MAVQLQRSKFLDLWMNVGLLDGCFSKRMDPLLAAFLIGFMDDRNGALQYDVRRWRHGFRNLERSRVGTSDSRVRSSAYASLRCAREDRFHRLAGVSSILRCHASY